MASIARTTHRPSSNDPMNVGTGSDAGKDRTTRASVRYAAHSDGQASPSIAFTNTRRPSSRVSRDARPGENPPVQFSASATRPPTRASMASRVGSGISFQRRRSLLADITARPLSRRDRRSSRSNPRPRPLHLYAHRVHSYRPLRRPPSTSLPQTHAPMSVTAPNHLRDALVPAPSVEIINSTRDVTHPPTPPVDRLTHHDHAYRTSHATQITSTERNHDDDRHGRFATTNRRSAGARAWCDAAGVLWPCLGRLGYGWTSPDRSPSHRGRACRIALRRVDDVRLATAPAPAIGSGGGG